VSELGLRDLERDAEAGLPLHFLDLGETGAASRILPEV
jgi:hypothetical protein